MNKAIALQLTPMAQAFAGKLTRAETERSLPQQFPLRRMLQTKLLSVNAA
jgi:hypothetical protein